MTRSRRLIHALLEAARGAAREGGVASDGALDRHLALLQEMRRASPQDSLEVDRWLLDELARLSSACGEASEARTRLGEMIERLTSPPWHEAIYLGRPDPSPPEDSAIGGSPVGDSPVAGPPVDAGRAGRAIVFHGSSRRVVSIADGVDASALVAGAGVFLNEGLNLIVAGSGLPRCGELAAFDRLTPDGRLILRDRDESVVVQPGGLLRAEDLRPGDLVRWSRSALVAVERVDRSDASGLFLEETPSETFDDIGGLDAQVAELREAIELQVLHPAIHGRYGLSRAGSILLEGPPGCGKTLTVRAAAGWLRSLSPSGRSRLIAIKPAALHSSWYSETERRYRELFQAAREAGNAEPGVPVVIFLDEVESTCKASSPTSSGPDDRVVAALAAELDGLEARGNILVLSATNHRDAIDPRLDRPGRLSDRAIRFPRPDRAAAAAILGKHLGADLPYADGGPSARERILDAALSSIYSPNGGGVLATLLFSNGARRPVLAAEVASGALLREVGRSAREAAAWREARGGPPGIRREDVETAVSRCLDSAVRALTPWSCRRRLEGLPEGLEVVAVTLASGATASRRRFLRLVLP